MSTIGFTFPFSQSRGAPGFFATTTSDFEATEANLKSLVLTNWGERLSHFDLGCNLIEFNFELEQDDELKDRVKDRILSQINRWMPWVLVKSIEIMFQGDSSIVGENEMRISVTFTMKHSRDSQERTLQFSVPIQA